MLYDDNYIVPHEDVRKDVIPEDPLNPELGPEHREHWIRKADPCCEHDTDGDGNCPIHPEGVISTDDIPDVGQNQEKKYGFGIGADPLTAGFNAAAAFFNFLSTVQGQRVVERIIAFDDKFVQIVSNIAAKIHNSLERK
jgi:hypothetical protein